MKRKIALASLIVILVFGGLAGIKALQIMTMVEAGENMGPFPTTVEVRPVQRDAWEQRLKSIGSVAPVNGTVIRSEPSAGRAQERWRLNSPRDWPGRGVIGSR